MFEKLVKYIEDTELTVLEGATIEFEPYQYKLLVLEDVLTVMWQNTGRSLDIVQGKI